MVFIFFLLCIRTIVNLWSRNKFIIVIIITKTGLYGNVYVFAVDYVGINDVKTIYDIHRYLMKKHKI